MTGRSGQGRKDAGLDAIFKAKPKHQQHTSTSQAEDVARKQTQVGYDYLRGEHGKPQSKMQAERLFRKAVASGYTDAMPALSEVVGNEEAAELLFAAAQRNNATAMGMISVHFAYGSKGFPQDLATAREWANKANATSPGTGQGGLNAISFVEQTRELERQRAVKERREAEANERRRQEEQQRRLAEQERQQELALQKAERDYQQQLKEQRAADAEAARRAKAKAEAEVAADDDAQLWRDTLSHIEKVGNEVATDLRNVQRDTARAYQHDLGTQRRNERRIQDEYEQKKRTIIAENERKRKEHEQRYGNQDFSRKSAIAQATKSPSSYPLPGAKSPAWVAKNFQEKYLKKAQAKGGWDCKNHWRPERCGDRTVEYNIKFMGRATTGTGRKLDGDKDHSGSDSNDANVKRRPRFEFKRTHPGQANDEPGQDIRLARQSHQEEQSKQLAKMLKKSKITGAPLYKKAVAGEPGSVDIIALKDQVKLAKQGPGHFGWGGLSGWPYIRTAATCQQSYENASYEVMVQNDYRSQEVRAEFNMYVVTPSGKERYPTWTAILDQGEKYTIRSFILKNTDCLTAATIITLGAKFVRFKEDQGLYAAPNNR